MLLRTIAAIFTLAMPGVAAAATAYVTNEQGGVSVIDLDTLTVVKEIDVGGKQPRGLALTEDGAFLVTANKQTDDISVIDTRTGTLVKRVTVGKGPEFVRIHGGNAYVTYEPDAPGPGGPPHAGAEKPPEAKATKDAKDDDDDDRLARVAIIDVKTWKIKSSIISGLETEGIEFSPDGKNIVLTNEGDETITIYALADGKLVKTVDTRALGKRPRGLKITPDGEGYLATLEGSSTLVALDSKFEVVKSAPTKTGPYGLAYTPDGKQLLVAASRASTLQVLDAQSLQPVTEAAIGMRCWHFAYAPGNEKILVACGRSNDVRVLNAKDYQPVATIPGFKLPWGIVTYPRTNGSLQ